MEAIPEANNPFIMMTGENASATFLEGTRGEGKTQSPCWEPEEGEIYGGAADTNKDVHSRASVILQYP